MPFIHIKVAGPKLSPQSLDRLQQGTSDLMQSIMRKRREVTAVLVEKVELPGWTVGGEVPQVAAHVEANVTLGTNTPAEKESFVRAMDELLKERLGPALSAATYVIVREVQADAWGYDGSTQELRRKAAT